MKKHLSIMTLAIAIWSCGGGSTSQTETTESDAAIADDIIQNIEEEKTELANTTEATLSEVDSLLQNL